MHAVLDLTNQIDQMRGIRSVTWSGVGPAESYLKTLREVALPAVKGQKTLRLRYSTPLPETAIPGFYQFTVSAVLDDGSTVSSTASFSIEEAFTIQLEADPAAVALIGPTEVKLQATIGSAAPGFKRADVLLDPPASWELIGKAKRSVNLHRENSTGKVFYVVTVPSATQTGEYRIAATMTCRGTTRTTHRVIKVTRVEKP
jgi:hypothetical protein